MSGRGILKVTRQEGTRTKPPKRVRFALKQNIHFESFILSMKELIQLHQYEYKINNMEKDDDAKIKE